MCTFKFISVVEFEITKGGSGSSSNKARSSWSGSCFETWYTIVKGNDKIKKLMLSFVLCSAGEGEGEQGAQHSPRDCPPHQQRCGRGFCHRLWNPQVMITS